MPIYNDGKTRTKMYAYVLLRSYGSMVEKTLEKWNSTAEITMQEFAKSGHPVFRCSSSLSRGVLDIEGGARTSSQILAA